MGDLAVVLCETFHPGAIDRIVHGDVALCVADDHPLLEEVELERADLVGCHVHVDFLDVTVERAPDLDLVPGGGKK
jgi:hypothetical protein